MFDRGDWDLLSDMHDSNPQIVEAIGVVVAGATRVRNDCVKFMQDEDAHNSECESDSESTDRFVADAGRDKKSTVRFVVGEGSDSESTDRFVAGAGNDSESTDRFVADAGNDSESTDRFVADAGEDKKKSTVRFVVGEGSDSESTDRFVAGEGGSSSSATSGCDSETSCSSAESDSSCSSAETSSEDSSTSVDTPKITPASKKGWRIIGRHHHRDAFVQKANDTDHSKCTFVMSNDAPLPQRIRTKLRRLARETEKLVWRLNDLLRGFGPADLLRELDDGAAGSTAPKTWSDRARTLEFDSPNPASGPLIGLLIAAQNLQVTSSDTLIDDTNEVRLAALRAAPNATRHADKLRDRSATQAILRDVGNRRRNLTRGSADVALVVR
jgi:hypothetical protein